MRLLTISRFSIDNLIVVLYTIEVEEFFYNIKELLKTLTLLF